MRSELFQLWGIDVTNLDQLEIEVELATYVHGLADRAYCKYIDLLGRDLCLGSKYKIENGKFTAKNLTAHNNAMEQLGRHKAYCDVLRKIELHCPKAIVDSKVLE